MPLFLFAQVPDQVLEILVEQDKMAPIPPALLPSPSGGAASQGSWSNRNRDRPSSLRFEPKVSDTKVDETKPSPKSLR